VASVALLTVEHLLSVRSPISNPYRYFPAFSLANKERLTVNFGGTPLDYPVEGFAPMQRQVFAFSFACDQFVSLLLYCFMLSYVNFGFVVLDVGYSVQHVGA
jgi:hypothetical protein